MPEIPLCAILAAVLQVLVLDDESMVVDTLAVWLRMPGIQLTTCLEIEAAEALLSSSRFDVVVTDLSVSQLGGLEGLRLVRFVTTNFPDTEVYVLSGYVDEMVRSLCSMLGVSAVLEKPEGLVQLRRLLVERRDALAGFGVNGADPGHGEPGEVRKVELLEDFLAADTIRSVLQPIIRLRDGSSAPFEIFGVEGLARGTSSSLLGSPIFLLSYAARKELLFEVDMICIRAALSEVRDLASTVTSFLNVQPRSLTNPDFTASLCREVRAAGLEESSIVLELTEQQTIVNHRAFETTLRELRECGFRIALDDFGEGSSNLNLFQELRPDYLKISSTFCRDLAHDPFKQIIVRSTAEMAARAGTATIMEAVETLEDAEVLGELGIDYAQGYFFLPPLPGRELARSPRVGLPHPDHPGLLSPLAAALSVL
jgi:EAL domain-containing protein (putative c-di-GMP-specific phosphodiesterase class I)/ActR/RegA family two-component response regulator